jgi:hypothetical protein
MVRFAVASGLRPIDILLGVITPLLYLIGAEGVNGLISVADEHRFTSFCERVFECVQFEIKAVSQSPPVTALPECSS